MQMSSHADGNEFCTVHPYSLDLGQKKTNKKTSNHIGPHNIGRVKCGICMIKVHVAICNSFGNNCIRYLLLGKTLQKPICLISTPDDLFTDYSVFRTTFLGNIQP